MFVFKNIHKSSALQSQYSLKQPEFINADCEIVETKIPIGFEQINDCNFHSSVNENEMNFQYLKDLEVESLNSDFNLKEAELVLSVEENSTKKSNIYEEKVDQENTSSEGLILKELLEHLKYVFLQLEQAKPVIISTGLTELEEQKLLEFLENTRKQ